MQQSLNIPLLVAMFIMSLAAISGENYVEISFTGSVTYEEEQIDFIGKADLNRMNGTFNGSGYFAESETSDKRIDFRLADGELTISDANGERGSMNMSDFSEVRSVYDYLELSANELLAGAQTSQFEDSKLEKIHTLEGNEGASLAIHQSKDPGWKGAAKAGILKLDSENRFEITINNISFRPKTPF